MAVGAPPAAVRAWPQPIEMGLAAALVAATGCFAATLLLREPGTYVTWADLWLYNGVMALAAAMAVLRGLSHGGRTRPWLLIAAALVTDALGGVAYWAETEGSMPLTVPPVSDWLWLSYYPLVFGGLLLLTRRRLSLRANHAWLDAIVVGAGAFAVAVSLLGLVVEPESPGADTVTSIVNSLYLVGDLILVALVLTVVQAFAGRPPTAWWLLMAGYATVVLGDTLYLIQQNDGSYTEGSWLDLLWPLSAMLIGLAAWKDQDTAAPPPPPPRRVAYLGPSIAILLSAAVLLAYTADFLEWVALGAAFLTVVLAVVRLNLDVQQSLRLTAQLRRSHIDPLTGLLNRRGLLELETPDRVPGALVLLDLDSFKDVNDSMGHEAGDRLLIAVAERLREGTREADVLARLGGDEFAVVLWGAGLADASAAAEGLILDLEAPMTLDGIPLVLTACAGVADSAGASVRIGTMLQHADAALFDAKSDGPGLVRVHTQGAGDLSQERLRVRAQVRAALDAGGTDFVVHYQPMIGLHDGSLLCVEALVRWQHEGRLVPPGEFLPEVIRGGEMPDLTRHMLRTSLAELAGHSIDVPVTVNVPPELITPWLLEECSGALQAADVAADRLIVEITEEAIMKDTATVAGILSTLRTRGVRVLLDDFGTGWSGLSSLRDLIVNGLKIDHSFVSRLTTDPTAAAIVRAISSVADELGLIVIYEGAEDRATLEALRALGTGYVQGFALARPMPVDDLVRWLQINRPAPSR